MSFDFLNNYLVLVVVGICLCIGFIIKEIDAIPNKFIPTINAIIGLIFNIWSNNWVVNPDIVLGGLFSGLIATGAYEAFKQWIYKTDTQMVE